MPRRIQLAVFQRQSDGRAPALVAAGDAPAPSPVIPAALLASGEVEARPHVGAVLRADRAAPARRKPAAKKPARKAAKRKAVR